VNKSELIDKVAASSELNKASAERAVEAILDHIMNTLKNGQAVTLSGFGTFSVSNRAARTGRNPRTGEAIAIAASKNPKFKAGKGLKDAVN
jgi:DNA-binding protein HU-beta